MGYAYSMDPTKVCAKCRQRKSEADFYKRGSSQSGVVSYCKPCVNKRARRWARDNPEKVKRSAARWYRENREKARGAARRRAGENRGKYTEHQWASRIKSRYGVTREEYERMVAAQEGKCKICGRGDTGRVGSKWPIDHDHKTGQVRGLLCVTCNSLLGHAKDSPGILRSAIEYLDSFERLQVTDRYAKSLIG